MALVKMTQAELATELAERMETSRSEAKNFLAHLNDVVVENLGQCIRTEVAGVTIEPKLRAATKKRMGRNPATGEEVQIAAKPASVRVAARVSGKLKAAAPAVAKLKARS